MKLSKYMELPDGLEPKEVEACFYELLNVPIPKEEQGRIALARAFSEVADRQWHTYERLNPVLLDLVDNWALHNLDASSEEITGRLVTVIGNIGLPRSFEKLARSLDGNLNGSIRKKLKQAIDEIAGNINDPYLPLRKYSKPMIERSE